MMQEIVKVSIGIILLLIGIPIGNFLARITKEEKKKGILWFKIITLISLICGFAALILGNDVLLFSFFFIAIVASRSLS